MAGNKHTGTYILAGIAVAGLGYLYWRSKENEKEGNALLEYIGKAYSQVDKSAAGDQAISETRNIKVDPNKLRIDNLKGKYSDAIAKAIANTMLGLKDAMKGAGTDMNALYKQLGRIKSKNTLAFVDKLFKAQTGTGIFEWMKDEKRLNDPIYGAFSDKTSGVMNTIPFSKAYWNPIISEYLKRLPEF